MKPYFTDSTGGIVIYHGDAHELLPDLRAEAVVTDPPYGVDLADWDRVPVQHDLDLCRAATEGPVVWFGASLPRCVQALLALTPTCDRVYIWHNPFTLTNSDGAFWSYQPIFVWGHLKGMARDVIISTSKDEIGRVHPAQKPERVMRRLVESSVQAGETIIDPFMGSGTTLRAAKDAGRRAIGIEKEERYCEIAARRLAQEVFEFP